MIRVNNRQVVREVAMITYRGNRKRNLLSVFAMVLTTFMIAVVTSLGVSYWNTIEERQLRMEGMDYDVELTEPRDDQVEAVRSMEEVEYAGLCVKCALIEEYQGKLLDRARLYWVDETCWEKQIIPALEKCSGSYPKKENEIMLSVRLLKAMGIENPRIGMEIPVTYYTLGEKNAEGEESLDSQETIEKEFTLCGFYSDYTGRSRGYVSKAFYETTGVKQTDFTQGTLKITLKNSLYSAKKLDEMSRGLDLRSNQVLIGDPQLIESFLKMAAVLFGMLLMIFASGYLFIYNTMYISISKDIRYYGQLKTLGMTSRQLGQVVYTQVAVNSLMGIPAGLLAAVFVTKKAVPGVLMLINPELGSYDIVTAGAWIFLLAGGFSLFTNLFSSRKPARIAGDCSPVEAMRCLTSSVKIGNSSGREDISLISMAFLNMLRDKKQAAVIFLSFVIGISVFCVMNGYVRENDAKHILNESSSWDMEIVNQTTLEEERQIFTEDLISGIKNIPGVRTVGKVFSAQAKVAGAQEVFGEYFKELYGTRYAPGNYEEDMEKYRKNPSESFLADAGFIAIDEESFYELNESLGNSVEPQAFFQGEVAVATKIFTEGDDGMTGKTVRFTLPQGKEPGQEHSIRIGAVDTQGIYNPATFSRGLAPDLIVSEKYARELLGQLYVEKIRIAYEKSYDKKTEEKVKELLAGESQISFDSRIENYEEMRESETQAKVLGYGIGGVVAALALLNYLNMLAASVVNRSREFGILESIGMTTGQIRCMLRIEGLGYGVISIVGALPVGLSLSYLVFLNTNMYYISFSVPWVSNLLLFAGVMAVCVLAPVAVYGRMYRDSIVEQLREGDA